MRILFDQGTPVPLREHLAGGRIAILVLPTTSWPRLQKITSEIAAAVGALKPGQYMEIPY